MSFGFEARPCASALTVLSVVATVVAAPSPAMAAKKKKAVNARTVNGLKASKTPKPNQLVALDKNAKLPLSVFPTSLISTLSGASGVSGASGASGVSGASGASGATGPQGPQGPKGDTGTVDTSSFYTKGQSDGRFLQVNPAARQDPPATPAGAAAVWVRPTNTAGGSSKISEFKVGNDGGLLAAGELGVGAIPATGCGYRLMWHPSKAAFRAGSPGGCPATATTWDDASTGFYSWAGGNATTASAFGAFAFGDGSTASGTEAVAFGSGNTSSGTISFTEGASNKAEGFASTAIGFTNRATGQGANALGYRVGAIGDYSTALGYRAVTASGCPASGVCDLTTIPTANGFDGAFVWGDESTTNTVAATAHNQWTARAAGGFRLFTNAGLTTGCTLPAGSGVFACTSDRNAKRDFRPVKGASVLERLASVPITTWRYKTEDASIRHMGPMAQDFRRAFNLGFDDKHIGSIDEDGVNMAAIKELYDTSKDQQRQLHDQRTQIAQLQRQVAALAAAKR
jgi:hypothetical protein